MEAKDKEAFRMAGITAVLSSHQWFAMNMLDNSEYITSVKLLIMNLKDTAANFIDPDFGDEVEANLRKVATELFVKFWIQLAREHGDLKSEAEETKEATSVFDGHYDSVTIEYEEEDERPENLFS